jgi:hypothetical protein
MFNAGYSDILYNYDSLSIHQFFYWFCVSLLLYFSFQPLQASTVRSWQFGKFSLPQSSWHIYLLQKLCTVHIILLFKSSISCLNIHDICSSTLQWPVRHFQQINTKWIWMISLLQVNMSQNLGDVNTILVMKDVLLLPWLF